MELSNLNDMEKVMAVYDDLGGDASPVINDLVTPFRKLIRVDDVQMREAPFSHNKKQDNRMYIFRDLIILAKPNGGFQMEGLFSKISNVATGLISRRISASSAMKMFGESTTSMLGSNGKYKVTHYLDLHRCQVKEISPKNGESCTEIELTHISRESKIDGKTGSEKFLTKIEKIEISFSSHDVCDEIYNKIQDLIDEIEELEMQRRESNISASSLTGSGNSSPNSSSSSLTDANGEPKKREWAKRRSAIKHKNSNKSMDGAESLAESVGGLSLADIESRYNLKFTSTTLPSERAEFEVQFGEGPMGFALGSSAGVGVVVGKLAPGGFAEIGGVSIGDRIMSLNDTEVGLDVPWQKVVDDIKVLPRPITIKFERLASRQLENGEHADASKQQTTPTKNESAHKQRSWAARRAHAAPNSAGSMINLHELEKMYKSASTTSHDEDEIIRHVFDEVKNNANENEAKCLHVLKEIYTTEKLYVADLRTLVGEYIIPLRRTVRRSKCKDVEGGSTICEHGLIRSTCSKTSHEIHPMMSQDDVKSVFLNVETLVSINSELLSVLEKELIELGRKSKSEGKAVNLGSIVAIYAPAFVKVMPFFKMYSMYCHKYTSAAERLQEIRDSNREIDDFLAQKEQKSQKTSLRSLLIKPIQRICKYPLLFTELLRTFPQTPELATFHKEISDAAQAVDTIAESVNKNVGDREAVEKIMEAYEELGGEQGVPGLITAHRRFMHHNNVLLTVIGEKEAKKEHTLYLFNDLIILAKGIHSGFSVLTKKSSFGKGISSKFSLGTRKSLGPIGHGGSNLSASSGGSGSNKRTGEKSVLKVAYKLELRDCEVKLVPEPDNEGNYHFVIKYIERTSERDSKTGLTKVLTNVIKYEVWCPTKEEQEEMYNEINFLIQHQQNLVAGQKKAEAEVGNSALKPKRSWKEKASAQSMEEMASRYTQGKKA